MTCCGEYSPRGGTHMVTVCKGGERRGGKRTRSELNCARCCSSHSLQPTEFQSEDGTRIWLNECDGRVEEGQRHRQSRPIPPHLVHSSSHSPSRSAAGRSRVGGHCELARRGGDGARGGRRVPSLGDHRGRYRVAPLPLRS